MALERRFHKAKEEFEPQTENFYRPLKRMIRDNFIGGIAWSLGATVGITLIITLLSFSVQYINAVPFIGETLADVITATNKALKNR